MPFFLSLYSTQYLELSTPDQSSWISCSIWIYNLFLNLCSRSVCSFSVVGNWKIESIRYHPPTWRLSAFSSSNQSHSHSVYASILLLGKFLAIYSLSFVPLLGDLLALFLGCLARLTLPDCSLQIYFCMFLFRPIAILTTLAWTLSIFSAFHQPHILTPYNNTDQ